MEALSDGQGQKGGQIERPVAIIGPCPYKVKGETRTGQFKFPFHDMIQVGEVLHLIRVVNESQVTLLSPTHLRLLYKGYPCSPLILRKQYAFGVDSNSWHNCHYVDATYGEEPIVFPRSSPEAKQIERVVQNVIDNSSL